MYVHVQDPLNIINISCNLWAFLEKNYYDKTLICPLPTGVTDGVGQRKVKEHVIVNWRQAVDDDLGLC